ncbi:MAG: hypothetical protein Q9174_005291 [Haloplaca sp. 1 TL-2023]
MDLAWTLQLQGTLYPHSQRRCGFYQVLFASEAAVPSFAASYESPLGNLHANLSVVLPSFDGAITTRVIHRDHHAFAFEVIIQNDHPQIIALRSKKPPAHFHPYQSEFMEVIEGTLGVEIEGVSRILLPKDGQIRVEPWTNHRMFPPPPPQDLEKEKTDGGITRFLLSGGETAEVFRLDTVFFQNWYGYQDEVVMGGKAMDLVQLLCVSDPSFMSPGFVVPCSYSGVLMTEKRLLTPNVDV